MTAPPFVYLGSSEPNAPPCAWCKRRPQAAIAIEGDVVFTGRCEPCADALGAAALGAAAERHRQEREQRERQAGEMAQRAHDGKPAVMPARRFKRGDS